MHRCRIVHPLSGDILDDGLAVFFKGPRSFTTEDVLELHVHSGRAVVSSVLNAIACLPFCRPAEPGEFTRRAFEGGRLDLTQVEGLRDLIDAETEVQRKLALRNAEGTTRARLEQLRTEIIQCMALVEALIDFGEGEDIEEGVYEQARERVERLRDTIAHHLADKRKGEIMRSGIRLAIFGPPNAGKSSLLNFLAQREAAIVTPVPGTTRDILELSLDIGGLPVIVADTAGLRKTDDVVESIGVERARKLVDSSDVALCVLPAPDVLVHSSEHGWELRIPPSVAPLVKDDTLILLNKIDLLHHGSRPPFPIRIARRNVWQASLSTRDGTQDFMTGFAQVLQQRYQLLADDAPRTEDPLITHARHRVHLSNALEHLQEFLDTSPDDVVLAAEELRRAIAQSGFHSFPPAYPLLHIDALNNALASAAHPDDVDPVLYISGINMDTPSACCHVKRGDLRYLCPVSGDVDPLYAFAFLQTFIEILHEYFGHVSAETLKQNFDVVYQLLEETLDSGGHPLTTSPNALRDIVIPPTLLNKVLSVAGVSGLATSSANSHPFASPIPWRKTGVRYNNNEIFFDVIETLDAVVNKNGTTAVSSVWGRVETNCKLSGTPDLLLTFSNASTLNDCSFHPCVRLQRWARDKVLSFVPPDGKFKLMEYRYVPISASSLNQVSVPFILRPAVQVDEHGGSIELTFSSRLTTRTMENHIMEFQPKDIDLGLGTESSGTLSELYLAAGAPRPSRAFRVRFEIPQHNYSALKIEQLKLTGENYKPYKGMRGNSLGDIEWRW
ncbi:hypothetical protein ACG7TL_003500 [Trametes sanguinea]